MGWGSQWQDIRLEQSIALGQKAFGSGPQEFALNPESISRK